MTETTLPACAKCGCEYTYEEGNIYICPECAITVIKDLKIKGSSSSVKVGTKVKNIRLAGGDHDIDCVIPGMGKMGLKSEFVKKV